MTNGTGEHGAGEQGPVLLFDGVCNLCNGAVQFIIRRDPRGAIRFASLQSEAGGARLTAAGIGAPLPDSMVLLEDGRAWMRSDAALRITRRLRWPWRWLGALVIVPRPVRDWLYDFVAARRYRWFGRRDSCMVPTPELRARFLDGASG